MDQDQGGGVSGSSDASMTADYVYARQLVQAYFVMLMTGCQRGDCTNENCCSIPQTTAPTATEAAIKSIYYATQAPVPLCVDYQQEGLLPTTAANQQVEPPAELQVLTPEQPQADEEKQLEEAEQTTEELHQGQEELHPETIETGVPKIQPEGITNQSITTMPTPERKSTPRQRLSVAVQLDNGLNKNRELPPKRPTVITRVIVQAKHKSVIDPAVLEDSTSTVAVTKAVEMPAQQQEQEQAVTKVSSAVKDARKRRISRPKEKLFDAIKRSFSRTKKAPLGSTSLNC